MSDAEFIALQIADMQAAIRDLQRNAGLAHSAIDDGAVAVTQSISDDDGQVVGSSLTMLVGQQFDGTSLAASLNGPVPPTPNAPDLTPGLGGAKVTWDGTYIGADGQSDATIAAPMDYARTEVHASTDPADDAQSAATLVGTYETPRGGDLFIPLPNGAQYVRLVTRSLSGGRSQPSDAVAVTPLLPNDISGPISPPATSPVPRVSPGSGAAVVTWDPVAEAESYDLYVSAADGAPQDASTLWGSDVSQPVWVTQINQGSQLSIDNDAFYSLVARNDVDAAAPSVWVPGRPGLIDNRILDASLAVIQNVVAQLVQTNGLQIGSGSWRDDIGFDIPGVVHLPVDGTTLASLLAAVTAQSLIVKDSFSLRGKINNVEAGAQLALAAGVGDPSTDASVGANWPTSPMYVGTTVAGFEGFARDFVDSNEITGHCHYAALFPVAINGITTGSYLYNNIDGYDAGNISTGLQGQGGVICTRNYWWVLGMSYLDSKWYVLQVNRDFSGTPVKRLIGAAGLYNNSYKPTIVSAGPGGDAFYCVGVEADGNLWRRSFTLTGTTFTVGARTGLTPTVKTTLAGGVVGPSPGHSTNRLILFPRAGNPLVYALDTGARVTAEEFVRAAGREVHGADLADLNGGNMAGSSFVTLDQDGQLLLYSDTRWNHDAAYTFYDGDTAGTGVHETGFSPVSRVAVGLTSPGAFPQITLPPVPDTGEPDSPDRHRVFVGPSGGVKRLQVTTDPGQTVINLTDYDSSNITTEPLDNFADAGLTPGAFRSTAADTLSAIIDFNGDGEGRAGFARWDAAGRVIPMCELVRTANYTLANQFNSLDGIGFWTEVYDPLGMSVDGLVTIPEDGVYSVIFGGPVVGNGGDGRRIIQVERYAPGLAVPALNVGASSPWARSESSDGIYVTGLVVREAFLVAGTRLRPLMYQTSGGAAAPNIPSQEGEVHFTVRRCG